MRSYVDKRKKIGGVGCLIKDLLIEALGFWLCLRFMVKLRRHPTVHEFEKIYEHNILNKKHLDRREPCELKQIEEMNSRLPKHWKTKSKNWVKKFLERNENDLKEAFLFGPKKGIC